MISTIARGEILLSTRLNSMWTVIDWDDKLIYLVKAGKNPSTKKLTIADFWKVTPEYLKKNFIKT